MTSITWMFMHRGRGVKIHVLRWDITVWLWLCSCSWLCDHCIMNTRSCIMFRRSQSGARWDRLHRWCLHVVGSDLLFSCEWKIGKLCTMGKNSRDFMKLRALGMEIWQENIYKYCEFCIKIMMQQVHQPLTTLKWTNSSIHAWILTSVVEFWWIMNAFKP